MITYYRKAWDVIAYTYHADIYCVECGESLPELDPEGNDKHPVFESDEIIGTEFDHGSLTSCGNCGEYID